MRMEYIKGQIIAKRRWLWLLLPLLYLAITSLYPIVNGPRTKTFYLGIFIDDWVKFSKYWIIPYVIWYLYLPVMGAILLFRKRKVYYTTVLGLIFGVLTCYLIYLVFQSTVPRPIVEGNDFFSRLVRIIYSADQPYNCLPSIHVLTTYLFMIGLRKIPRLNFYLEKFLLFIGWLIIISTLYVKQHVFLDIVTGIVLAQTYYYLIERWLDSIYQKWLPQPTLRGGNR